MINLYKTAITKFINVKFRKKNTTKVREKKDFSLDISDWCSISPSIFKQLF